MALPVQDQLVGDAHHAHPPVEEAGIAGLFVVLPEGGLLD
jgi:hypothetical protein